MWYPKSLKATFVDGGESQLEALINLIQAPDDDYLCSVRTPKRDNVIPRGQAVKVSCRANTGPVLTNAPVLFEPVSCLSGQQDLRYMKH